MKLKNIIKIGSFVVAGALPTASKAQVYMCQACPAGTYSNGGSTSCTPCPAGTYSNAVATSCTKCPIGTYSSGGAGQCTLCPAGTYSETAGATECTKCPAGTYSSVTGATNNSFCTSCPSGYWSDEGSALSTSCGKIQIRFCRFERTEERGPYNIGCRWFNLGDTFNCNRDTFNNGSNYGKCAVGTGYYIFDRGVNVTVCRGFPCVMPGNGRGITFNIDGNARVWGGGIGGNAQSGGAGQYVGSDIRW